MSSSSEVDILFRRAEVFDGSGNASFIADVAVKGDKIAAIGRLDKLVTKKEIDCAGYSLSSGFIDTHTHDDRVLIEDRDMACKVSQGVTSVVIGNCGISLTPLVPKVKPPAPFHLIVENECDLFSDTSDYFRKLTQQPPAVNFISLIGHSTLRISVQKDVQKGASESEIEEMCRLLDEALLAGAKGLSIGLEYSVAQAAKERELLPLLKILKKHNGVLTAHIRTEADEIMQSLQEVVSLARLGDVPLIISHHKCAGRQNFGRSIETLAYIDKAAISHEIVYDAYPYTIASTVLQERFVNLSEKTIINESVSLPKMEGKELKEIAASLGCSVNEAIQKLSPATAIYHVMSDEDVKRILAHRLGMIGSDGLHDKRPHPRLWGAFTRFLGHYVRGQNILTFEEAIRKITKLPAQTFHLEGRGEIKVGAYADIVLFDKRKIMDAATFDDPTKISEGIVGVYVNGVLTWAAEKHAKAYAGHRL